MVYRRRYRGRSKKQRYSVETTIKVLSTWVDTAASSVYARQAAASIVPANPSVARKVAHLTIDFVGDTINPATSFAWAVVYVPASLAPNILADNSEAPSFYEPNQFLMASGIVNFDQGRARYTIPLKRILHSNDDIRLLVGSAAANINLQFICRYAITNI